MASQSPEAMAQKMLDNLPEKTGKTLAQWHKLLSKAALGKHGEMVKLLKSEHGVTHGFANLIVHEFRKGSESADDPVAAQYSGAKAGLRPLYDALIRMAQSLGSDVEVSPKKSYVSLRRKRQFALIQPSTKDRIDAGINLKGEPPSGRLEASGSFNAMVSHRVRITAKKEINAELKRWLKAAYERA